MRFFVVSLITYIVLSAGGALLIIWRAGPNPDGFGPGLAIVGMMIYVLPFVSLLVGGIASIVWNLKSKSDAEDSDDTDSSNDGPRFNECG